MTFGDSEGRSDTLAGSLTEGWVATLPADVRSGGGSGGGGNVGATKALTGTNAIVCAAGGGPLLTRAAAAIAAAKQSGMSLGLTASATAEGVTSIESDLQVCEENIMFSCQRFMYGLLLFHLLRPPCTQLRLRIFRCQLNAKGGGKGEREGGYAKEQGKIGRIFWLRLQRLF